MTPDDIIQLIKKEELEEAVKEVEKLPEVEDVLEIAEITEEPEILDKEELPTEASVEKEGDASTVSETVGIEFKQTYIGQVAGILSKNKYYPRVERNRGREGIVKVRFTIKPNGEVFNVEVHTPSRFPNLDKAAIETVERSSPFPSFEDSYGNLPIILALEYTLDD